MMSNLISKIIDNLQFKITNVYIRIEDTLSIPSMPFALGIIVGSVRAETMNGKWQPQFTANAEATHKELTVKDFAVYMDCFDQTDLKTKWKPILFEDITADWKEKDLDKKYARFLKSECSFEGSEKHNYLIERFAL